jgi:hypothetical protein
MAGEGEEEEEADLTKTPIMKEQWITIHILTLACITSLLRIRDVYPGSNKSNKRGGGKILLLIFFCCHKFYRIVNYFIFEQVQKEI